MPILKKNHEFFSNIPHERRLKEYIEYLFIDEEFNPNGKKILLVGGGGSPILTDLLEQGFRPKSVTNVDPYASPQNDSNQILYEEDFLKHKIFYDFYDEIWALYSLPYWLDDIRQTDWFLANALLGLAPNGNLRIHPIPLENQVNDSLQIINKFAQDFTDTFPKTKFKLNKHLGVTGTVVFSLPHYKESINEWLEKKYNKKPKIIRILSEALQ